jgi:hypothetical protein
MKPVSWLHTCASLLGSHGSRITFVPSLITPAGLMQRLSNITTWPVLLGSDQVCAAEPALHGSITTDALTALADAATQSEVFFLSEITNLIIVNDISGRVWINAARRSRNRVRNPLLVVVIHAAVPDLDLPYFLWHLGMQISMLTYLVAICEVAVRQINTLQARVNNFG